MSGGVDSAVSALLLRESGHEVEGLFMFNWAEEDDAYCTAAADFESARAVCAELRIPLHRADFSEAYRERVFAHFLEEYAAGRTPNPDLLCNREVKFGEFAAYARRLGADAIATGHYARLVERGGKSRLMLAADPDKDQTYFLAAVHGRDLQDVVFPLQDLHKPQVRALALQHGLPNHQRRDSTGICFIGERPMREFLARYLADQPGPVLDRRGRELGSHPGLCYFTLGQRRGLGIGGVAGAEEAPWYVVGKDSGRNALIVSQDPDDPGLISRRLRCAQPHWIHEAPELPLRGRVRIRHRGERGAARVLDGGDGAIIEFEQPVWGAAPGQYAVIYRDDECLGCAVIAATETSAHRL